MQSDSRLGRVVVAPEVLLTIVRQTVLSTPGVGRLTGTWPANVGKLLGIHSEAEGLSLTVANDALLVDVHIVADAEAQMLELGRELQRAVSSALQYIVGLEVKAVNVHIEDVEALAEQETA